ncbi:hypothetical protein [Bacillus toyonensis]|uniref:hypothetical protein n=1 Tax=Bacillus toyonensis TaxID=155322 RepID=UPI000BF56AFF|nr:hypothetical protein [Bacillus toyonensis]MBH0358288.1 hypothetical protein [Bacillus toyonensis biovar Thuringiensis]NKW97327.1 hypothetical protein [Bacillus toyonensis]PFZ72738.1 hypothetical protein COL72_10815 [Bacillus toyonensis]
METLKSPSFLTRIDSIIDNVDENTLYNELLKEEQKLLQELKEVKVSLGWKNRDLYLFAGKHQDGSILYLDNNVWWKMSFEDSVKVYSLDDEELSLKKVEQYKNVIKVPTHQQKKLWIYGLRYKIILASFVLKFSKLILQFCKDYIKERKTFGVPIAKHQMVYDTFVIASSEIEGNILFLRDLSTKFNMDEAEYSKFFKQINFMLENSTQIIDKILPVLGAFGLEDPFIIKNFLKIHHISMLKGV